MIIHVPTDTEEQLQTCVFGLITPLGLASRQGGHIVWPPKSITMKNGDVVEVPPNVVSRNEAFTWTRSVKVETSGYVANEEVVQTLSIPYADIDSIYF